MGGQSKAKRTRFQPAAQSELEIAVDALKAERIKCAKLEEFVFHTSGFPKFNPLGCTYNMDTQEAQERLCVDLWADDYTPFMSQLRDNNPVLGAILSHSTNNTYVANEEQREMNNLKRGFQLEGTLSDIARQQSQKLVTFTTGALSVLSKRSEVSVAFTEQLALLHRGTMMSPKWLKDFLVLAPKMRPSGTEQYIEGIEAAFFDNFTMQMMYGAYETATSGSGIRQDMTNWGSLCGIPRHLAPTLDAKALFMAPTIFRTLSGSHFSNLFRLHHPQIVSNKAKRWVVFLTATASGTLFARPRYISSWHAEFNYYEPMWGVLQSSSAHVKIEIDRIRAQFPHAWFVFVGGDGLSLMRMNHLLNSQPDVYLHSNPVCLPVQGEHPHGTFHVLHAGWRMYLSFIRSAFIGPHIFPSTLFREEPTVEDFNHVRFLLFILIRACAEYVLEISRSPGGIAFEDYASFMAHAERNIDFAWVVHFLADYGFLLLQFQQSVRGNDSHTLDLLWREFYGFAHNGRANKTQYCPMAIMRVYWGMCLVQPLHDLYHAIRTIPTGFMPGTCVGWDMPIERLNAAIRRHVRTSIRQELITAFIAAYTFLEHVGRTLLTALKGGASRLFQRETHAHRDIETDVRILREWLRAKVGVDWAHATRVNTQAAVTSDSSRAPWLVQRDAMCTQAARAAYHTHISSYVTRMATWASWSP